MRPRSKVKPGIRRAAGDQYAAPDLSVCNARIPYRARLVLVDRNDDAAGGVEPLVAAAGIQQAAAAISGIKREDRAVNGFDGEVIQAANSMRPL